MWNFGHVWIFGYVWTRLDTFGYVWTRLDTFGHDFGYAQKFWIRFWILDTPRRKLEKHVLDTFGYSPKKTKWRIQNYKLASSRVNDFQPAGRPAERGSSGGAGAHPDLNDFRPGGRRRKSKISGWEGGKNYHCYNNNNSRQAGWAGLGRPSYYYF